MPYEIRRPEDYRRMPWKNGRGFTVEIGREPADDAVPFGWRLSMAEVKEDGPFSFFPGYERVINTLEGAGLRLVVDGRRTGPLLKYAPFIFSGDARVESELIGGPIRDFNLIYDPAIVRARLQWLEASSRPVFCTQAAKVLIFSVGETRVETEAWAVDLARHWLLRADNSPGEPVRFALAAGPGPGEDTHCGVVEIDPRIAGGG